MEHTLLLKAVGHAYTAPELAKTSFEINGDDAALAAAIVDAIHHSPRIKRLIVHSLYADAQHDFEGCPVCNKVVQDPQNVEHLSDPLVKITEGFFSAVDMDALREVGEEVNWKCRECGCTQFDCRQCIEKTGEPCHWVEPNLCSACAPVSNILTPAGTPAGHGSRIITDF